MTKQMQEIQNEFLEKFPELKDFPALAMEMQTFLHKSCTRYAQGMMQELEKDPKRDLGHMPEIRWYNYWRKKMLIKIQEDTPPITS